MRLSGRARRAVALMLVAVVAVAAISIYYLRPWTAIRSNVTARPASVSPTPGIGLLTNYFFVSTALGWSVATTYDSFTNSQEGTYGVYKTVDAGKHWQRRLAGKTSRLFLTFSSLWFADAHTGYVVGGDPIVLYATSDGGDHWTTSALPVAEVQELQFVDRGDGFAVSSSPEQTEVFATHDGGATWGRWPAPPSNRSFWPQFRNPTEVWSGWLDTRPLAYLSLDGGATWDRRELPLPAGFVGQMSTSIDVKPLSPLVFAYVSLESENRVVVYSSVDYGKSWTPVTLPGSLVNGLALTGVDATHWWAADGLTLYRSDDGGREWVKVGQTPPNLRLLQVIDSRHAWGVQEGPDSATLMLTSDGGLSWDSRPAPNPL